MHEVFEIALGKEREIHEVVLGFSYNCLQINPNEKFKWFSIIEIKSIEFLKK
jgi:hypothetical protein